VDANEFVVCGKTEAGSVWPVGRAQVTRKLTPYSRVSRIQLYMYVVIDLLNCDLCAFLIEAF
jgi:hypothetical protein